MSLTCIGYYGFQYYNSSTKDIIKLETELYLSSDNLTRSFRSNEVFANSIYAEKIIEVEGSIKEIVQVNERYTVVLQGEDEFSYILCDMLPEKADMIENFEPGQTIYLKGICKGYLNDVIMLNCIVVNQ